jgi:RNA polymerase sigma-70 factor, ECF subfamily
MILLAILQPASDEVRLLNVTLAEMTASLAASAPHSMSDASIDAETTRLAMRAQAGDADAFCALIDLHHRAARRVARAALASQAEADDAVQEACVTAWQRIASLEDPAAFRSWLLRITWRKALDRRRSLMAWVKRFSRGDRDRTTPESVVDVVADPAARADDEMLTRERDRSVAELIRSLPARLRDPFLLAAAGEYRYEDIGAMLGIPVGTVKWRVSEARRVLREKLGRVGLGLEGDSSGSGRQR